MAIPFLYNAYFAAKVGIGTASPSTELHVQGSSASDVPIIRVGGFGNSGSTLELAETLTSGNMTFGFSFEQTGNGTNELLIKRHNNSTSGAPVITLSRINNNVSMSGGLSLALKATSSSTVASDGGTTLTTKNYVDSLTPGAGVFLPLAGGTMLTTARIQFYNANQYIHANSSNDLTIASADDINYLSNFNRFYTGGLEFARLSGSTNSWLANGTNGQIGIGTTTPSAKLSINAGAQFINFSGRDTIVQAAGDPTNANIYTTQAGVGDFSQLSGSLVLQARTQGTIYRDIIFAGGLGTVASPATQLMTILGEGLVGIGTSTPARKLDVAGDLGIASSVNALRIGGNGVLGVLNGLTRLSGTGGASGGIMFTPNNDNTEKMRITSAGDVGIGTTAPTQRLHISGNMRLTGAFRDRLNSQGAANYVLTSTGSNGTQWVDASGSSIIGGPYLPLTAGSTKPLSGILYAGQGVKFTGGTIAEATTVLHTNNVIYARGGSAGMFLQNADGSDGMFIANDHVRFETAGSERMRINNAGNVGIGTSTPQQKLDIKSDPINTDQPVRITNSVSDTHTGLFLNGTGGTVGEKYGMQFGAYNQYSIGGIFGVLDSTSGSTSGDITFDMGNGTSSGALVERMRITHEGNVGIGTTTPTARLDILTNSATGTNSIDRHVRFRADNGEQRFDFDIGRSGNSSQLGMYNGSEVKTVQISTVGDSYFNGGDVGIGETSIDARLHITAASSSGISNIKLESPGASKWAFGIPASQTYFALDDTNDNLTTPKLVVLKTSGNVGIGTTSPGNKLVVRGPSSDANGGDGNVAQFEGPSGTNGFQVYVNDTLNNTGIQTKNGDSFIINPAAGNVGIGVTPTTKLHVAGTGLFTGLVSGITPVAAANFVTKAYVDGSGGGTGPFLPLAGGTMTGTNGVIFPDNFKLKFGAGTDLEIFSNGTIGVLKGNDVRLVNAAGGNIFRVNTNAAELYYSDSKRFETTAGGTINTGTIDSTGTITVTGANGNVGINTDTGKLLLGASYDLQMYHDGSTSFIKNTTGVLAIQSSIVAIENASGANYFVGVDGAQAELYYNGSSKLQTTNTGIAVTGAATSTTATIGTSSNATLTTKSYVDGLVTGVPVYKGTWAAGTTGATSAAINSTTITLTAAPAETIAIGDIVTADGITAAITVTAVGSQTSVTVNASVTIASGVTVTFSPTGGYPNLTLAANKVLGNYYIVSTAGSAAPNGVGVEPDSWNVGDWCIFSDVTPGAGTDLWQRIDNSSVVSGAGTGQSVTKWEGTSGATSETLTDGPITFSTNDSTFAGTIETTKVRSDIMNNKADTANIIYRTGTNTIVGNNADALVIQDGGNVGIGTTSPQRNLTIYASSGNAVLQLANNTSGVGASDGFLAFTDGTNVGLENKENGYLSLATNASEKMRIASNGNVLVGGVQNYSRISVSNGNSARTGITLSDENTASLMLFAGNNSDAVIAIDTQNLVFKTNSTVGQDNGNERMRITSAGNVGIGQTSPGEKLVVAGKVVIENALVPNNLAQLNIGSTGAAETRAIDIDGNWTAGESKSITFTYGSAAADMVGQIKCMFNAPSSSIKWGRLYHGGLSSVYTMELESTSQTTANLTVAGSIQMADDTATPSATKVGTMRYRTATDEAVPVTGTELVTGNNGNFAGVANGTDVTTLSLWGVYGTVTSRNVEGEKLKLVTTAANTGAFLQVPTTIGNKYQLTFTASGDLGTNSIYIGDVNVDVSTLNSAPFVFTATQAQTIIYFRTGANAAGTTFYDNIQLIEVTEEDASYADMCMQTGASAYEWVNIVRNTY